MGTAYREAMFLNSVSMDSTEVQRFGRTENVQPRSRNTHHASRITKSSNDPRTRYHADRRHAFGGAVRVSRAQSAAAGCRRVLGPRAGADACARSEGRARATRTELAHRGLLSPLLHGGGRR